MSITLSARYELVRNMSAVQRSSRSRGARPRRPGTRPSAARRSSASADADGGEALAAAAVTALRLRPALDEVVDGGERGQQAQRVVDHGGGVVGGGAPHGAAGEHAAGAGGGGGPPPAW